MPQPPVCTVQLTKHFLIFATSENLTVFFRIFFYEMLQRVPSTIAFVAEQMIQGCQLHTPTSWKMPWNVSEFCGFSFGRSATRKFLFHNQTGSLVIILHRLPRNHWVYLIRIWFLYEWCDHSNSPCDLRRLRYCSSRKNVFTSHIACGYAISVWLSRSKWAQIQDFCCTSSRKSKHPGSGVHCLAVGCSCPKDFDPGHSPFSCIPFAVEQSQPSQLSKKKTSATNTCLSEHGYQINVDILLRRSRWPKHLGFFLCIPFGIAGNRLEADTEPKTKWKPFYLKLLWRI